MPLTLITIAVWWAWIQFQASAAKCRRLCKILVREYRFGSDEEYDLVIHQEYFGLRIRPDEKSQMTFTNVKQWELERLIKNNIDDKPFISTADLQKYTSDQMVRAIVTHHSCWGSSPDPVEIENLVQAILQKKARKLLALCVYKHVDMKCLKKLIDVDRRYDNDLPSTLKKCCEDHQKYPMKLSQYHGIFQVATFNTPGEYQQISSRDVLPVIPVDADGDKVVAEEMSRNSEEDPESPNIRSRAAKERAMIGLGSHGWVYRVRIDPYHHKISDVSIRPGKTTSLRTFAKFRSGP